MGASVLLLLFQLFLVLKTNSAMASSNVSQPQCQDKCGNVSIPYPFGIGTGCFREGCEITCKGINGSQHPFFRTYGDDLQAMDISLLQGQARVRNHLAFDCYDRYGKENNNSNSSHIDLRGSRYKISASRNKFTAVGCDTIAYIVGSNKHEYQSGCMSFCNSLESVSLDPCTGTGCCQTSIPENLVYVDATFLRRYNGTEVQAFNPCSYGFVAEQDWFRLNASDLQSKSFLTNYQDGVPLVLDWVVGDETCDKAVKNSSYACLSSNSVCLNSTNGLGYICNCSPGYEGNPYLQDGCQDINECDHPYQYACKNVCDNTEGGYKCSCPPGTYSDDPKSKRCEPNPSPDRLPLWIKLALGIGVSIVCLLVLSFWIYIQKEKRKLAKEKERFFQQNGGLLLYEEIKSKRGATFKIFNKEELEKATNKFDNNLILGRGGHGTVYRGILESNVTVAIKKSKTIDESQKEEFVKEILILSQINHTNVVKLLGCCLEVEVPMLVYEFVSNGTLYDYIHDLNLKHPIRLDTRLRIAIESTEALAYLHSSASPPILHGDVKSSNILLDQKYVTKVSDFGASILVAMDETQLATVIQGTFGYLDPEYVQTYTFTEKSDVYSFGVVLLELLTRKKAYYFEGLEEEKSLASRFISLMKESRLTEFFDNQLMNEGQVELLLEVSELAKQCLSVKGEERPTMKEVAEELQRLRKFTKPPWEQHNLEELESLPGESLSYHVVDTTGLGTRSVLNIEAGR